jgi:hypothetical protein
LSQGAVVRIWRAFGLQPHRVETFKLSAAPFFVDKIRDIVGLYLNPPAKALVLCVDEKSKIQALDRTQPSLPIMPGLPERRTHDYCGTYGSTLELERAIKDHLRTHNDQPKPFSWTKTADEILDSIRRFCMRISDSRH